MAKTVVGLFDTTQEAQSVVQDLVNGGFDRNNISLVANDPNGEHMQHSTTARGAVGAAEDTAAEAGDHAAHAAGGAAGGAIAGGVVGGGIGLVLGLLGAVAVPVIGPIIAAGPIAAALTGAGIGAVAGGLLGALTNAGVPEEDAHYYTEGVNRGGTLLMVKSPDEQAQTAYDIMQQHGAVDIEERGAQYKQSGFTGYDPNAQAVNTTTTETMTTRTAQQPMQARQAVQGQEVLPVVQEEMSVGKRQVQRGGARVYTHVSEQPVEQQVQLRDEQITIDRQPVNRAVSQADMANMKDGTIEVTETDEEPVVSKQARVVEEVHVGKQVSERTETVRDQVRRSDVEVEQLGTDQNQQGNRR